MDVVRLVGQAERGNVDAFTDLVRRYQAMAFGYAYATLGDFHLAEDIVQQAFVVAYNNLSKLEHQDRFGGWLRGIVRFECLHLLRSRRDLQVPIETVSDIAETTPGPAEIAEQREGFERVLAAIHRLPRAEREATILFYIYDHSQRDVAEFLNLPLTTVNNRLRSARKRLKEERLLAMTKDAFKEHDLPEGFAEHVGEIVRLHGPILDVRFAPEHRPSVLSALTIIDEASSATVTAEVAQHLADDLVRCVISTEGPTTISPDPGMRVVNADMTANLQIQTDFIKQVIASMRRRVGREARLLETGIKAVDVLTPIPIGGLVGLIGDAHTGKMVLVEELIHRLADAPDVLSVIVFVRAPDEVADLRNLEYRTSAAVEAIYLPVADASADALAGITDDLDAVISLSRTLANDRLYPAIDPLESTSQMLDPATIGQAHFDVATGVRQVLETASEFATDVHSPHETTTKHRAALIQRFLTQPFFVAEPFTKKPGLHVPRDAAVQGCGAILQGTHDELAEEALYMTGTLEDALARS